MHCNKTILKKAKVVHLILKKLSKLQIDKSFLHVLYMIPLVFDTVWPYMHQFLGIFLNNFNEKTSVEQLVGGGLNSNLRRF